MSRFLSITGVDGCGKSTLMDQFCVQSRVKSLRVPQFYETKKTQYRFESDLLEKIGKFADKINEPIIKINASYIAFTLYGLIVDGLKKEHEVVLTERFPVVDTMSFSKFYLSFLQEAVQPEKIQLNLEKEFSKDDLAKINKFIVDMKLVSGHNLYSVHEHILHIMRQPFDHIISSLFSDFHCSIPEKLIILRIQKESLEKRMFKDKEKNSQVREAHEKIDVLMLMQDELINTARKLRDSRVKLDFEVLNVDHLSSDDLYRIVCQKLNLS